MPDSGPFRQLSLLVVLVFGLSASASAADFYIDPIVGSSAGDGSAGSPWRTLEEVWADGLIETQIWESLPYASGVPLVPKNSGAPVQAGDTLWLRNGFHGDFDIRGAYNAAPITIAAEPGHQPRLSRIDLSAAQHWVFRGLPVSASHASPPNLGGTLVAVEDHGFWGPTWDVTIEDCDVFSIDDASGWGVDEWINDASSGISMRADRVTARRNRVRNTRHGITASGDHAVVSHNLVDGFSADGLRGLGDDSVYEYNRVQNNLISSSQGDGNHDDGFQSWSSGPGGVGTGEVKNVVLRGNLFISHVDPDHPLRSTMQGVGCFDGLFVNWVVENNVVITDHWHGITFHGMIDSRIVNNTVIDINDTTPGPPWIRLTSSDGTESENVIVRNNLATAFTTGGINISDDHNLTITNAGELFLAAPYDLRLLPASAAVDTGSLTLAAAKDVRGFHRPQGPAPDLGAYESCPGCLFVDDLESGALDAWMTVP